MTNERGGDGNDKRPEMSFEFSTGYESDDKRRNKREDTWGEGKVKSVEEELKTLEEKVRKTTLSCFLLSEVKKKVDEEKVTDKNQVIQEPIYSSLVSQLSTQTVNYLLSSMEELVKYFNSKGFL